MKIAVLTADYPPDIWSGIGVAVHRQVCDLEALGVEVEVVVARSADAVLPVLHRLFDADGADWIHLHSLPMAELAIDARRRWNARLVYTVHTQPWLELPQHSRRRFWLDQQARLLGVSDRVIFLSAAEHAAAQALFPDLPPASVIPNGVARPPANIPGRDERRLIAFAGRFATSKGVLLLEQCIRRLKPRTDLRFVIAGGHGDDEGSAAVQRLSRDCDVRGWLPHAEVEGLLAQSRLVLVPSRYEPFGLIALEAMRVGTPVLAAHAGGLRELAREGSGGVLLDSTDPDQWADAAMRIICDEVLWSTLHRNGPAFIDAHYNATDVARRLLDEVYQSVFEVTVTPT